MGEFLSPGVLNPRDSKPRPGAWGPGAMSFSARVQKRVNAVKRLAVSTGPLRALLLVHIRPIDLVVFQEPSPN